MSNAHAYSNQDDPNTVNTINPATGEILKSYTLHTKAEAEEAVEKAHEAFLEWRGTSMDERAQIIKNIGKIIEREKESLAKLMAQEMGKPVTQAEGEIDRCVTICNFTADEDAKVLADEERELKGGEKGIIAYQPIGVILGIEPWNFPLYQVIRYSIPNLMAGNAVILKHAQNVWGMATRAQEIYEEAGLPKHLFTALFLENEETSALIAHDKIRGVTFTGSARAGKIIGAKAGEHLKKSVLELGGSDPYIILEDCDLDKAVKICVAGRTNNAGQTCVAAKRFIVVESIYDAFKEKFTGAMKAVTYGNPMSPDTKMGPIARDDLREKLHAQVTESIEKGATCLIGGELPQEKGYFYPATILENITPDMPAYHDELFGPVASLFKVKDEEEAIKLANDHAYGLGGGVMSGDTQRAINVAKRIDTGMVSINGYFGSQPNMPFGGVKESGYGREHGGFGIKEFVNIKSIYVGHNT